MKKLRGCLSGCFTLILVIVVAAFVLGPRLVAFLEQLDIEFVILDENGNPIEDSEVIVIEEENEVEVEDIEVENIDDESSTVKVATACKTPTSDARYRHDWEDLSLRKKFAMRLSVEGEKKCQATQNRENFEPSSWNYESEYFQQIYKRVIDFDDPRMSSLLSQFEKLKKQENLGYAEFAEVIVTFVQHIPYVLVLDKPVREALKDGEFYVNYIQIDKKPYTENKKFGIHSPIEFLHTQEGDCDTRTVLLYAILSHFGYDVVIINNPAHSMLGINLPATGTYLSYQGKKYYLWETTSRNWVLGNITPENKQGLYICLPSKNNF